MTDKQPTMAELQNEIIRLNKMVSALIKRADAVNADKMTDFSLFQTQVMLQDEVMSRTEQLENALLKNNQINAELIDAQRKMASEIEERKLVLLALEQEKSEQKELIQLRKQNKQLLMENDILKQAALIFGRRDK